MDTSVKLDGQEVAIKSGTSFIMGEGMLVTEDAEVVVNGDLYLLERGDRISFSEAKKKAEPKPKKITELPPGDKELPSEDEWEEEEDEEEYEEDDEYYEER
jgi:hypothetical protein